MKRQAGLWIDHREAIVVFVGDNVEETKRIESGLEKHVRFSNGSEPRRRRRRSACARGRPEPLRVDARR